MRKTTRREDPRPSTWEPKRFVDFMAHHAVRCAEAWPRQAAWCGCSDRGQGNTFTRKESWPWLHALLCLCPGPRWPRSSRQSAIRARPCPSWCRSSLAAQLSISSIFPFSVSCCFISPPCPSFFRDRGRVWCSTCSASREACSPLLRASVLRTKRVKAAAGLSRPASPPPPVLV